VPAVLRAQRDTTPEARAPLNELLRDENDDLAREERTHHIWHGCLLEGGV
jgi:hypothetical protein